MSGPTTASDVPLVVLVGAWDTKAEPLARLHDGLLARGCAVHRVDYGTDSVAETETTAAELVRRAGTARVATRDRSATLDAMGVAVGDVLAELDAAARVDALLMAGGSGAGTVFAHAAPRLGFGTPKVLVSTIVAGDTRGYLQGLDALLFFPVVDVEGDNHVLRSVLDRAVVATAALAHATPADEPGTSGRGGQRVAVTMFGITTPAVSAVRRRLEERGDEVLAFHANGTGGAALERMVRAGEVDAVVDLTTTELADEVAGGMLGAGEDRLRAAAETGVPQVVVPGALDTVNFGPPSTVPERLRGRTLHSHNRHVTLMRVDAGESARLGELLGERLAGAAATSTVVLPLGGVSELDRPDGPFWDPGADEALREALRRRAGDVRVVDSPHHVNDDAFAAVVVAELDRLRGRA